MHVARTSRVAIGRIVACAVVIGSGISPARLCSQQIDFSAFATDDRDQLISALALTPARRSGGYFERTVLDEADALGERAGVHPAVWTSTAATTSAHPLVGIIVNPTWLETLRRQTGGAFPSALRFVLAHELGHIRQFTDYGAGIASGTDDDRRALEAQADVLGGYYVMASAGAGEDLNSVEALEGQHIAFNLGVEQYALAGHPSHEKRLIGARLGMLAAIVDRLQHDGGHADSVIALRRKIDRTSGETLLAWSRRIGGLIAGGDRAALSQLMAVGDPVIQFNENGHPPIVTYTLRYRNIGSRPVIIDAQVQSASVPRTGQLNTEEWNVSRHWLTSSTNSYHKRIEPGATAAISGTLHWLATPQLMPRLVTPDEPMGLIAANFADAVGNADSQTTNVSGLQAAERTRSLRSESDSIALFKLSVDVILGALHDDPESLKGGIGREVDRDDNTSAFPISAVMIGAAGGSVWFSNDSSPYATEDFFSGDDFKSAQKTYQRQATWLRRAFPEATVTEKGRSGAIRARFTVTVPNGVLWLNWADRRLRIDSTHLVDGSTVTLFLEPR